MSVLVLAGLAVLTGMEAPLTGWEGVEEGGTDLPEDGLEEGVSEKGREVRLLGWEGGTDGERRV